MPFFKREPDMPRLFNAGSLGYPIQDAPLLQFLMSGTMMFEDKVLMITGGTGSCCKTVLKWFLSIDVCD